MTEPSATSTPTPLAGTALKPLGPLVALLGALIMHVCLFLPAIHGTEGGEIRPIEFPPAAWPHLMGLFAATGALLALVGDRSGSAVVALVLQIIDVVAAAGSGLFLVQRSPVFSAVMLLLLCLALASFRSRSWALARALWLSGLLALVCLGWFATAAEAAPGLWLSGVGALCMLIGGALFEIDARRAWYDAELPRAAIVQPSSRS